MENHGKDMDSLSKYLFEEYADFGRGHGHDLADFDTYHRVRDLNGQLLMVKRLNGDLILNMTIC